MKILLTGGTGLIGSALVNQWHDRHELIVLSRSAAKVQNLFAERVQAVTSLSEVDFNTLDAVVNLAGEPIVGKRWSDAQKQVLCDSRWHITQQLVEAIKAAQTPPKVLLSGSAIGIYGRQQSQLINEDFSHFHAEFSQHLCQHWEELALAAAGPSTRVCVLRTGIVLANNGGALQKMLPPFKAGLGGRIGSGQQFMSWIHINDMLRLTDFLLQHPTLHGAFNATAPQPVTNAQFSQTLAKVLHRPALLPMPAFVLRLMFGEMADLLLTGQRVIPVNLIKAGFGFQFPELEPALRALQAH